MTERIVADLAPLVVPLDRLRPLAGNPRRGDVEAVSRSLERFGQHRPVVARPVGVDDGQPVGEVLAGNHLVAAARLLGWTDIAVVWVDDDDTTATARALADNRTSDLGTYDDQLLAEALRTVSDDGDLLRATGYLPDDLRTLSETADDLDALLASFEPEDGPTSRLDERRPVKCPACGHEWRVPR